ncbi:MAG: Phosphatidylglycerol--prolipoprotein diacylglyceryl transferase [Chlamydiales bacterium]|nr:Phosphatidylglycerol--prolipoprotein diacylglyceryl transferase [Chlamydiales bacterium]
MGFGHIAWDPDRIFFVVPYINHPVTWYGVLFAFGFLVGYFLTRKLFTRFLADPVTPLADTKLAAIQLTDRLALFVVLGTIIGARLGHVFFYGWSYYSQNPLDIFKIWEGGLASHGGALGVLLGLLIFIWWNRRIYPKLTFLSLLDILVVPTAFVGACIRVGNFVNQEITGIPTKLPWAVIFVNPVDGYPGVPLHPVQLYEAVAYLAIFCFLYLLWKARADRVGLGMLSGWFFTLVFGFRFVLEFFKMPQHQWLDQNGAITMGQLLSIPFILLGIALLIYYHFQTKNEK